MNAIWFEILREPLALLITILVGTLATLIGRALTRFLDQKTANQLQESFQKAGERAGALVLAELMKQAGPGGKLNLNNLEATVKTVGVPYLESTMEGTINKLKVDLPILVDVVKANVGKQLQK